MRRIAVAPGETIKEQMEEQNIDFNSLAVKLDLSYEELEDLLCGKLPINEELAKKLENVFDIEKDFWLSLQATYEDTLLGLWTFAEDEED